MFLCSDFGCISLCLEEDPQLTYTQMHYDRLTLYLNATRGESIAAEQKPGLKNESELGLFWPLMERWHPVLEQFPPDPVVLDYSAKVCMGDCAMVDAAERLFSLTRGWIVLLIVDGAEDVELTKSWLCNVRLFSGIWNRTLVVSTDLWTVETLFDWNSEINVFNWRITSTVPSSGNDSPPSDEPAIRVLSVLTQILNRGIPVMLAEPGCVWTADPLLSIPRDTAWDVAMAWDRSQYSLGLSYLQPTERTSSALSAISSVISLHSQDVVEGNRDIVSAMQELSRIFTAYIRSNQDKITVIDLDPDLHWHAESYFEEHEAPVDCVVPLSYCARKIYSEAIYQAKPPSLAMTLQQFKHSFLSNDGSKCSAFSCEDMRKNLIRWMRCGPIFTCQSCAADSDSCDEQNANRVVFHYLDEPSTVYSFGTTDDLSFELELAARFGGAIYLFDTDPAVVEQYLAVHDLLAKGVTRRQLKSPSFLNVTAYAEQILLSNVQAEQLHFYPYGLSDGLSRKCNGGNCPTAPLTFTMKQIMNALGHQSVDVIILNFELTRPQVEQILSALPNFIIACCNFSVMTSECFASFKYEILGGDSSRIILTKQNHSSMKSQPSNITQISSFTGSADHDSRFHIISITKIVDFLNSSFQNGVFALFPAVNLDTGQYFKFQDISDPYLVHEKQGISYLFASVKNKEGVSRIAVFASSENFSSFFFKQIVLVEPWDLGWPRVIQHAGHYFMVTSATRSLSQKPFLWLYESAVKEWPFLWRRRNRIISGDSMLKGQALNPVLFFYSPDSTWYLVVFDDGIGQERLYFSNRVHSGYLEHPDSQKYAWRHVGCIVASPLGSESHVWAFVQPPEGFGNNSVILLQIERLSRSEFEYKSGPHEEVFLNLSENFECHHVQGLHSFGVMNLNDNETLVVLQAWAKSSESMINESGKCTLNRWSNTHQFLKIRYNENFPYIAENVQRMMQNESSCTGDCKVIRAARRIYSVTGDWVIIIVFNRAFIPMTQSWICNTEYIPDVWMKVLLISTDLLAVDELVKWKSSLNIVHWDILEDYSNEMKFGQVQYFRLMNRRLALTVEILENEIPILIAETDAVWTLNALKTVPLSNDWDIAAGWDSVQYMMGFMFIRPTTASIAAFRAVHEQYESILLEYESKTDDFDVDLKERAFAGDAILFLQYVGLHQGELKVIPLDLDMHVGGKWYNEETRPTCIVPYTVQNNWLAGIENKMQRMRSFGQWFLDDDNRTCISNSEVEILQSVSQWVKCAESRFVGMCGAGCIGTHMNGRFWARPLDANSVIYSFGIGEDLSFEIGLAARYGVTVHLFDPSPKAKDHFLWVEDMLERGWSDRRGPTVGNMSSASYSDVVLTSAVKKGQLIFHQMKLLGQADSETFFCTGIQRSSEGIQKACHEASCGCEGESVPAQSLAMISKSQGNLNIDLLILDLGGEELSVLQHLSDIERPKYIMIELHYKVSNFITISNILKEYNLVKLDKRYGTWKLRRAYECEELNPEFGFCPDGEQLCRGDLKSMFSIGLHLNQDPIAVGEGKDFRFEIQSAGDVTDISCLYMADPFLFHQGGNVWYLFTQGINNDCQKGEIALSVSNDGLKSFQYSQIVLSEPWHLSRPFVLEHKGVHYMLPSPRQNQVLWLYESCESDWPYRWERKRQILVERLNLKSQPKNPMLFYHKQDQTWYLMILDEGLGQERVYFSDRIDGGYIEHQQSKQSKRLHAGRMVLIDGTVWAFLQSEPSEAGFSVVAVKLEQISRNQFQYSDESIVVAGPFLGIFHASKGMLTYDLHWSESGSQWVSVVDGLFFDQEYQMWWCLTSRIQNNQCWHLVSGKERFSAFRSLRCDCSHYNMWENQSEVNYQKQIQLESSCPLLSPTDIGLINSALKRRYVVLEYGCSEWTIFFSGCVSHWLSFEHENSACKIVQSVNLEHVDIVSEGKQSSINETEFNNTGGILQSYCLASLVSGLTQNTDVGLILVDSQGGLQCVVDIVPWLSTNTSVVIHSAEGEPAWWEDSMGLLLELYQVVGTGIGVLMLAPSRS